MSSSGATESKANASRPSNKKKKRKRISKHVQLATSKAQAASSAASTVAEPSSSPEEEGRRVPVGNDDPLATAFDDNKSTNKKRRSNDSHVKDPSEALSYLQKWKVQHHGGRRQGQDLQHGKDDDGAAPAPASSTASASSSWKFNKNTQSWLVRHMYEFDKVPKHAFELLVEYLRGMPDGSTTKARIRDDAHRRIVRYKNYQQQEQQESDTSKAAAKEELESSSQAADEKLLSSSAGGGDTNDNVHVNATNIDDDEQHGDELRWRQMNDHDRRKEYKRARRVLELFASGRSDGRSGDVVDDEG